MGIVLPADRRAIRCRASSSALVIAGSDKRGTIYGIYDLSEQIGVSPWYWWADVTPDRKAALYVKPGTYQQGEPSVKYRGIFFNDEKPDLDFWVRAKFGEHPTPGGGQGTVANFNQLVLRAGCSKCCCA